MLATLFLTREIYVEPRQSTIQVHQFMVLAIIGDNDIRREILSIEDILSRSSFDITSFIESKEMGRNARELTYCISDIFFPTSK